MNIILTGGSGYLGIHILNKLLKLKNINIIVIDNFSNSNPNIIKKIYNKNKRKITIKKIDITKKKSLIEIFQKYSIENIIHLAAKIDAKESIKKKNLYYRTNLKGTKNLVDLSNYFKVKRFIFASSAAVYGNTKKNYCSEKQKKKPINPYGETKLKAEEYIIKNLVKTNYYIARIFNLIGLKYGNINYYKRRSSIFFKLIYSAKKKNKLINLNVFKKNKRNYYTVRDFVSVDDASNILIKTLFIKKKNIIFNCGTGVKTQIIELINFYEKVLKIKFKIRHKVKPKSDPNSIIASTKLFKNLFKNYKMNKVRDINDDLSKSFITIKR